MSFGDNLKKDPEVAEQRPSPERSLHDLRASLVIVGGFNQALESSFLEMCDAVHQLISTMDESALGGTVGHVAEYEADCRFFLNRITQSLRQVNVCLENQSSSTELSSPTDADHSG